MYETNITRATLNQIGTSAPTGMFALSISAGAGLTTSVRVGFDPTGIPTPIELPRQPLVSKPRRYYVVELWQCFQGSVLSTVSTT